MNININMPALQAQVRSVSNRRPHFSQEMDESLIMKPLTLDDKLRADHARRTDVNTRLDERRAGRDYSAFTDEDIHQLSWAAWEYLHTPVFGEAQRGLAEMASALEQKLNEIANDTSISDERRAVLTRIWQEGFVKAVRSTERQQIDESVFRRGGGRSFADAVADVNSRIEYANQIANSINSLTDNPAIQNLILRGLDEIVASAILSNSTAFYLYSHTGGQENPNASNETAAFRREVTELFLSARAQWSSEQRQALGITRVLFDRIGLA